MALPEDVCHVCGDYGPLSFEHVPPKNAFNRNPVFQRDVMEVWKHGRENVKGWKQQKGAGGHTLCIPCNENTGHWYAEYFGDWCIEADRILRRSDDRSTCILSVAEMYPLRVIKQIITMFFSVNPPTFADRYPDLVQFVLSPNQMYLNPRYHVATYFAPEQGTRHLPLLEQANIFDGRVTYASEIAFYPMGYVLTVDAPVWDARLFDICHFARYEYSEQRQVPFAMPVLPTHLPVPLDFRTQAEIDRQAERDAPYWEARDSRQE